MPEKLVRSNSPFHSILVSMTWKHRNSQDAEEKPVISQQLKKYTEHDAKTESV